MALWNTWFKNNRKEDEDRTERLEKTPQEKFGPNALEKNPNLPVFSQARNNISDIIDSRSVVT